MAYILLRGSSSRTVAETLLIYLSLNEAKASIYNSVKLIKESGWSEFPESYDRW